MRLPVFGAGLFLVAIVFAASNPPVQALEAQNTDLLKNVLSSNIEDPINQPLAKAPELPAPVEHLVADNENLSRIAEAHDSTWQRLFAKNPHIENPDIITAGTKVAIPSPDEILPERELPEASVQTVARAAPANSALVRTNAVPAARQPSVRSSASGNGYGYGYCTYYAKQRRADLPNNLGNANTWAARAAAQGIPTGAAPRAGAIGQQGMHVVYVEAVNPDGSVQISEMNYAGHGVISSRTAPASSFQYIY